jgi:hypothetical protein
LKKMLAYEEAGVLTGVESRDLSLSLGEEELQLRIEEAICRYDGRILIGGEPKDAAEWAVREVSVWLRSPRTKSVSHSLRACVEDMVAMARKSPNSVDMILREMVGRRVRFKPE